MPLSYHLLPPRASPFSHQTLQGVKEEQVRQGHVPLGFYLLLHVREKCFVTENISVFFLSLGDRTYSTDQ